MTKNEALKILFETAPLFKNRLCFTNLLFIFGAKQNPQYIETLFLPKHYKHLTGVKDVNPISAENFFSLCFDKRLSPTHFELAPDGTTELKLTVLEHLMKIDYNANLIGDYNNAKPLLCTDKIVGGVASCIGFIEENGIYIPNTALNENIDNVIKMPRQRILATLKKEKAADKYSTICRLGKNVEFTDIILPAALKEKINVQLQTPTLEAPIIEKLADCTRRSEQTKTGESDDRTHEFIYNR